MSNAEDSDAQDIKEEVKDDASAANVSILETTNSGKPRRRYHRKNAKNIKLEDPNAPRRPRSAYVHFLAATRSKYASTKDGNAQREINEQLAAEWRSLTDENRAPFTEKAALEREEYVAQMAAYEKTSEYRTWQKEKERRHKERKGGGHGDVEEGGSSKAPRKRTKASRKGGAKHEEVSKEVLYNSVPVFSEGFMDYNKERENELRVIRKNITDTETHHASLNKIGAHLAATCETAKEALQREEKECDRLSGLIGSWLTVVREHCTEVELPDDDDELEEWLHTLSTDGKRHSEIDQVTKALSNVVFPFPK